MKQEFTEEDLKRLKEMLWAIGHVKNIRELNWMGIQEKSRNFEKKIVE